FISYRRADSQTITGRIYDRLADKFGAENVFKDVDSIGYGKDFRGAIRESINTCDVVLVIIGKTWLTLTDERGKRRIDNQNDFVRLEVENALQRDAILTIPVLVEGAAMPSAD